MYWEPTFYSVLWTGVAFAGASLLLYLLAVVDLRGDGPIRYVRAVRRARVPLREAAIICGLYTLWALIGAYTLASAAGAKARGERIWQWERDLHLPSEHTLQGFALHHPLWAKTLNQYYIYGHMNAMIVLLAWLWFRHRDLYPRGRLVVILYTLLSVMLQWIPVAPPRFLPKAYGMVDLGALFNETVYHSLGAGSADQFAAMPSVHEGWAILVGVVVWQSTRSRWRYLVALHPIFMMYVVVCTGNHYWADGIVSLALLALVLAGLWAWDRSKPALARALRLEERVADPAPVPVSAGYGMMPELPGVDRST